MEQNQQINPDLVQEGMELNIAESLVDQYYKANTAKLASEKVVKSLKPRITAALEALGKNTADVANYLISYKPKNMTVITDKPGLIAHLKEKAPECLDTKIDDDLVNKAVEEGRLDMADLTQFYGKELGAPALTIKLKKEAE